jgi:hypothetical protein
MQIAGLVVALSAVAAPAQASIFVMGGASVPTCD